MWRFSIFSGLRFLGGFDFQRASIFIRDSRSYQSDPPIKKNDPQAVRNP
jgi:hypothetical protein